MSGKAHFNIETIDNIIHVELIGKWNPVIDLDYLDSLSKETEKYKGKPWVLVVDMCRCDMNPENIADKHGKSFHFDRRSQKAELWIVNNLEQCDFLMPHPGKDNISVQKFLSREQANDTLDILGYATI